MCYKNQLLLWSTFNSFLTLLVFCSKFALILTFRIVPWIYPYFLINWLLDKILSFDLSATQTIFRIIGSMEGHLTLVLIPVTLSHNLWFWATLLGLFSLEFKHFNAHLVVKTSEDKPNMSRLVIIDTDITQLVSYLTNKVVIFKLPRNIFLGTAFKVSIPFLKNVLKHWYISTLHNRFHIYRQWWIIQHQIWGNNQWSS